MQTIAGQIQSDRGSRRCQMEVDADVRLGEVDAGPERSSVQFGKEPAFDTGKLILLVQRDGRFRFAGPDRVRIEKAAPVLAERVALVRDFLGRLA